MNPTVSTWKPMVIALLSALLWTSHATAQPTPTEWRLIGWNDLGMHCMDGTDFSVFSILPPYNTFHAHLIHNGQLVTDDTGITVTYKAVADPDGSFNSTAADKINFWDHIGDMFPFTRPPGVGLFGAQMPGPANTPQPMHFEGAHNWFTGEGIPITPFDDAGNTNYYPLMELEARDSVGTLLTSTRIVLPVSDEMDCSACHQSGKPVAAMPDAGWVWHSDPDKDVKLNILKLHDDHRLDTPLYQAALMAKGYNTNGLYVSVRHDGRAILCAQCHWSNALPLPEFGYTNVPTMTEVMHANHADVIDPVTEMTLENSANRESCYRCHPGSKTLCLRGAMGKAVAPDATLSMSCQDCHGTMTEVGAPTRNGWFEEPTCQSCHTGPADHNNGLIRYTSSFTAPGVERVAVNDTFAVNPGTLYRFSEGHGNLQCSTCHGSPHAVYPSAHRNDNLQNEMIQGHAGTVVECTTCHTTTPQTFNGGPHGMHPVGNTPFAEKTDHQERYFHGKAKEDYGPGLNSCKACHGTDYKGTVLSRTQADRVIDADDSGTKHFWKGYQIGCYTCHNGPNSEANNPDHPAVVANVSATTPANTAVAFSLDATDADNDPLTLRIVSQPDNGRVGLSGTNALYQPFPGFIGTDTFTFAAWDGEKDSNLGVGTITVTEEPCLLTGITYAPTQAGVHAEIPFWSAVERTGCTSPITRTWDFGDGATTSGPAEVSHAYVRSGTYAWSLVTEAGGEILTNEGVVVVGDTWIDTDGDGMEDDWEWKHFGSLDIANAMSDDDGDGSKDRNEFLAGTIPTNDNSFLHVSRIEIDADGAMTLDWPSSTNRSYCILTTPDLVSSEMTCLASNILAQPSVNTYSNLSAVVDWLQVLTIGVED